LIDLRKGEKREARSERKDFAMIRCDVWPELLFPH
jgi:hypothetical protein